MRPANIHELRHAIDDGIDATEFVSETLTLSVPFPMAITLGQLLDTFLLEAVKVAMDDPANITPEMDVKMSIVDMFCEMLFLTPFDSALVVDNFGEI